MRTEIGFDPIALLLRAGDVHPNPGLSLHIAQYNLRGFNNIKRDSLLQMASARGFDVILLQEMNLTADESASLAVEGFHSFALGRDGKGEGVAILTNKALPTMQVRESRTEVLEQITVKVDVGQKTVYFTSAYFPSGWKLGAAAASQVTQDN